MSNYIDIVLSPGTDGSPDFIFVEIEDSNGKSVGCFDWGRREDGNCFIRITETELSELIHSAAVDSAPALDTFSGMKFPTIIPE